MIVRSPSDLLPHPVHLRLLRRFGIPSATVFGTSQTTPFGSTLRSFSSPRDRQRFSWPICVGDRPLLRPFHRSYDRIRDRTHVNVSVLKHPFASGPSTIWIGKRVHRTRRRGCNELGIKTEEARDPSDRLDDTYNV